MDGAALKNVKACEDYSLFKSSIPEKFRIKRQPGTREFRETVGNEARRYRDKYFPATKREDDRQGRWQDWLRAVYFDEGWEVISRINDDVVNDMARGKGQVEFAIAFYYRLHAILEDQSFSDAVDDLVFDGPLREAGRHVFNRVPNGDKDGRQLSGRKGSDLQLEIWTSEAVEETRFLYRSRAIPYLNEGDGFGQLDRFNDLDGQFRWHVTYGAGGTGKSRLALEYAIENRARFNDQIGFLSVEQARRFDWESWKPIGRSFIIVDYAAREAEVVAGIVRRLSILSDYTGTVRLLLLERDMTGSWFDKVSHRGKAEAPMIEETWSGFDGLLEAPDDVWPIIQYITQGRDEHLPPQAETLAQLERIDHRMRPLFAAFLGEAYARGEDPRKWDARALVENVLQHEQRYWAAGGADQTHINLCACATAIGGIPADWVDDFARVEMRGFWPVWEGNKTFNALSAVYGEALVEDIPPLEPDILGEAFFLDQWRSGSRYEKERLVRFGCFFAPWFAEFLERAITDFPEATSMSLLETVITSDFEEYASSKPELLYNVVTALTPSDLEMAIAAYHCFAHIGETIGTEYGAECLLDSALNLIVGNERLDLDTALDIYAFARNHVGAGRLSLQNERARCCLSMSLIARFPSSEPRQFRQALADALRSHRRYPEDVQFRRDACAALSNFVNLLPADQMGQVLRLLGVFRRVARDDHADEMEDAWVHVLYHSLLVLIANAAGDFEEFDELSSYAFSKLSEHAPETSLYQRRVVNLWKKDFYS